MLDINNLREERFTWPGGFGVFSVSWQGRCSGERGSYHGSQKAEREGGDRFLLPLHLFHLRPQLCLRPTIIPFDHPLWKLTEQSRIVLNLLASSQSLKLTITKPLRPHNHKGKQPRWCPRGVWPEVMPLPPHPLYQPVLAPGAQ